jgi:hypothetical protein
VLSAVTQRTGYYPSWVRLVHISAGAVGAGSPREAAGAHSLEALKGGAELVAGGAAIPRRPGGISSRNSVAFRRPALVDGGEALQQPVTGRLGRRPGQAAHSLSHLGALRPNQPSSWAAPNASSIVSRAQPGSAVPISKAASISMRTASAVRP